MPLVSSKILCRSHSRLSSVPIRFPRSDIPRMMAPPPLCVGETGHFLSQVGGGRLVLALARLDGPGPATPSGFLLDVHEALLHVARSLSGV